MYMSEKNWKTRNYALNDFYSVLCRLSLNATYMLDLMQHVSTIVISSCIHGNQVDNLPVTWTQSTCMYVCVCVCVWACMCTYVYMYIVTCTFMRVHLSVSVNINFICIYVCKFERYVYTYINVSRILILYYIWLVFSCRNRQ